MSEKRKLKRRHLIYYLRVFDRTTEKLLGHLVNLSAEGAMLISEEPIDTETLFKLRMALPTEHNARESFDFDGLSIWCHRDVNPDFYVTGFKFLNLSKQDIEAITNIIDEFGFSN